MHPIDPSFSPFREGGWIFWSLFVPNVISPSCHFVLIKFSMSSNMVSNLNVFPNMLSIAPHLAPYALPPYVLELT